MLKTWILENNVEEIVDDTTPLGDSLSSNFKDRT